MLCSFKMEMNPHHHSLWVLSASIMRDHMGLYTEKQFHSQQAIPSPHGQVSCFRILLGSLSKRRPSPLGITRASSVGWTHLHLRDSHIGIPSINENLPVPPSEGTKHAESGKFSRENALMRDRWLKSDGFWGHGFRETSKWLEWEAVG